MARTVAEIEADIAEAKSQGQPPMGAVLRGLRAELKALSEPEPAAEVTVEVAPAAPEVVPEPEKSPPVDDPTEDLMYSTEWRFIEKACAEIDLASNGNQGKLPKKLYNVLMMKVKIRRIALEVVRQVGVGAEWPQWAALGRNEDTGDLLPPKPVEPEEPAVEAEEVAPKATAGGMPVRGKSPGRDDILQRVRGAAPVNPAEMPVGVST